MLKTIQESANLLNQGQILAYNTDTCLGIGHAINSNSGFNRLYEVKKMPFNKPCSVLVNSLEMLADNAILNEFSLKLAQLLLPGPYTLILPRSKKLNPQFLTDFKNIGFRYIPDPKINSLIKLLACPITTTSANIHTQPSAESYSDIINTFGDQINIFENINKNQHYPTTPSTIIEPQEDNTLKIIRAGVGYSELSKLGYKIAK